jgi:hypothetical protein
MTLCLFVFRRYLDQREEMKDRVRTKMDPDIHLGLCAYETAFLQFTALNMLLIQEIDHYSLLSILLKS